MKDLTNGVKERSINRINGLNINNRNEYNKGSVMKINDFKKSYLNLDSRLSKCTKPKDYFKPIQ